MLARDAAACQLVERVGDGVHARLIRALPSRGDRQEERAAARAHGE